MKVLERVLSKYILRCVYLCSYVFPVKDRVIFATARMDTMNGNYKYIYDEIKRRNIKIECKFLYRKISYGLVGKIKYFLHMMKATFYLATSTCFLIDDFYFPVYTPKSLRKDTKVIQVWHACGAFKKFGYSILDKDFGANNDYVKYIPIHSNYSHVLVSGKEVKKHYAAAFNMSEDNIDPIGIPRTDIFFNEDMKKEAKEKVYNKFPELKGKKVVLYAPTFRGNNPSDARTDIDFDIQKVINVLPEGYIFATKMHPYVKNRVKIDSDKFIDLSDYNVINDILIVTDLLITDYSSTVFEFALLGRPMIFFANDLERYEQERDFYYPYEEFVPGPIVSNTEDLIDVLENEKWDIKQVEEFRDKFFDYVDGKATERLINQILLRK